MNLQELKENYKSEIMSVASKYGVSDIRVFGSVARGDAHDDSDIDLMAKFPEKFSLLDLVRLERDLSEIVNRKVEVAEEGYINPLIEDYVNQDLVSL